MNNRLKNQASSYSIVFLIVIIALGCARIKTQFSTTELKWMNVYNEGDTLIFKSEKGDLDTSVIIKKELFYPSYNPGEVHDKYLPQWGVVWYKNKNLKNHSEGDKIITMFKKHPKNNTYLNINYLNTNVMVLNLTTGSIEKYKKDKVYEFDAYREKANLGRPMKIFWHEDYGIVKYITHGNVVWQRINL